MSGTRSLAIGMLLIMPVLAPAQDLVPRVTDLEYKSVDLQYNVEDIGGSVEGLALTETETEIRIDLAADVLFAFDSAEIEPGAEEALHKAAEVIGEYPDSRVSIEGHTDGKGAEDYNLRLSQQRADAVRDWFIARAGLTGDQFETQGAGESRPVAAETTKDGADDPAGRQQNRRVEIRVRKG
jgi:outer membrane protein OmpA-like peptidoglycan-associated protein